MKLFHEALLIKKRSFKFNKQVYASRVSFLLDIFYTVIDKLSILFE